MDSENRGLNSPRNLDHEMNGTNTSNNLVKMPRKNTREMIGGCCVCSDESGWAENPLVYCDGQGCNVAVHQGRKRILSKALTNSLW